MLALTLPLGVPATWTTVAAALILSLVLVRVHNKTNVLSLPPGPRGWPLIGSILEALPKGAWTTFTEHRDTYGKDSPLSRFVNSS